MQSWIILNVEENHLCCDDIQIFGKSEVHILIVRPRCARPYGELRVATRPISPTARWFARPNKSFEPFALGLGEFTRQVRGRTAQLAVIAGREDEEIFKEDKSKDKKQNMLSIRWGLSGMAVAQEKQSFFQVPIPKV